ncbi:DUF6415 family natural product biosynthesis protein [Streptomyces decoyicus]|uniref:DUF6415 family natural product biosynthesis protein n=1 Tax=Streptomyces decoyicus TaxID=249567 RepID=UPI002E35F1D8|nr:DUF6415 family natural product biosynthesis protein [Streptomyces decoyicus]
MSSRNVSTAPAWPTPSVGLPHPLLPGPFEPAPDSYQLPLDSGAEEQSATEGLAAKPQQLESAGEATATSHARRAPLDLNTVRYTISRARGQSSAPLNHEALTELETELSSYINRLMPAAKEAVAKLWHGGTAWHQQISRLDGIERQVRQGLGAGALSAHVQVQQLAKDCQWLIDHTDCARPRGLQPRPGGSRP